MFLDDIIDEERHHLHNEQGSDAWDKIRVGRFTSSEFYKLMDFGTRDLTPEELKQRPKTGKGSSATKTIDRTKFSDKALNYIKIKCAEILTGQPRPQSYAYPLVYGKEMEPQAVEHFEKITGLKTHIVGFQTYTEHCGGSPDRLIGEDEGLEIKCPYTSDKQIDYMMLTDHYDLKRNHPEYYWQCVTLLVFTFRKKWHFATFDPRFINEKHKMTHIEIEASKVQEDIDFIDSVIKSAIKEKLSLLKTLQTS